MTTLQTAIKISATIVTLMLLVAIVLSLAVLYTTIIALFAATLITGAGLWIFAGILTVNYVSTLIS